MGYRQELIAHMLDLRKLANKFRNSDQESEAMHLERIAEIIDFIVNHPDDALGELKREAEPGDVDAFPPPRIGGD